MPALAHEGLDIWLGAEFALNSTRVLQWMAAGVLMNSLGRVAFSFVQGVGRADLTGKLHLVELPLYLLAVWALASTYGIEGAAVAATLRFSLDTVALFGITWRLLPASAPIIRRLAMTMGGALVVLVLFALPMSIVVKISCLALTLLAFGLVVWFRALEADEKATLRKFVSKWLALLPIRGVWEKR